MILTETKNELDLFFLVPADESKTCAEGRAKKNYLWSTVVAPVLMPCHLARLTSRYLLI